MATVASKMGEVVVCILSAIENLRAHSVGSHQTDNPRPDEETALPHHPMAVKNSPLELGCYV